MPKTLFSTPKALAVFSGVLLQAHLMDLRKTLTRKATSPALKNRNSDAGLYVPLRPLQGKEKGPRSISLPDRLLRYRSTSRAATTLGIPNTDAKHRERPSPTEDVSRFKSPLLDNTGSIFHGFPVAIGLHNPLNRTRRAKVSGQLFCGR